MRLKFWKKKKCCADIDPIPVVNMELETREVKMGVYKMPLYVEPTDKEILEGLEFQDNYEAAFLIKDLKKQNMVLKGKLTKLTKKCNAYKEDLDNANIAVKQLMNEKHSVEIPKGGWITGTTKQ